MLGTSGEIESTGEMETADRYCLTVRLEEGTAGELSAAAEICTAVDRGAAVGIRKKNIRMSLGL